MPVNNVFVHYNTKNVADIITMIRMFVVVYIVYLALFSTNDLSISTIQLWLLIGWISDVADGKVARLSTSESSIIGRNERKVDLIMIGAAHLYIAQFSSIDLWIKYTVGLLGLFAMIQMYRTGDTDLFLQMLYITIICGYVMIINIILGNFVGFVALSYYLFLVVINWQTFKDRAKYFVSLGKHTFEN